MYEFAVDFIEPYNIRFSEKFECRTTKKRRKTDDNVIHVTDKPPRGGDSAYEGGGDARRLAQGCKFVILVSLRVFWAKRHHIKP